MYDPPMSTRFAKLRMGGREPAKYSLLMSVFVRSTVEILQGCGIAKFSWTTLSEPGAKIDKDFMPIVDSIAINARRRLGDDSALKPDNAWFWDATSLVMSRMEKGFSCKPDQNC